MPRPVRKTPAERQQERKQAQRDRIQEQIDNGELFVRQMTQKERKTGVVVPRRKPRRPARATMPEITSDLQMS